MPQKKQKNSNLEAMRHSCEHVLTMAMLRIWGNKIKAAMGPATDDGFYFDFDLDIKISEENFRKIKKEMIKIIKEDLPITKDEMTVKEARKFFDKNIYKGNEYKHEWLDEIESRGESVSIYWMGKKGGNIPETFVDICSGPHLKSTGKIGAFKLLKVAGAYWHGDEKNKMLQRIYGTAFGTQEKLDEYLERQEEAKKRDHRKLGKELDLFIFSDLVGKGLPMLTEKGAVIRRVLERFIIDEEIKRGYKHVKTPEIANVALYEKSGHYPYYKDSMYPVMEVDGERLMLRPMTCPHHFMLYKDRPRSYRDLPYRIAEPAELFRFEQSGELMGLIRVRKFCLADAHHIVRKTQALDEIKFVLDLIQYVSNILGLEKGLDKDYWYRLSLGNRKDKKKYYKCNNKGWGEGEDILRKALQDIDAPFVEAEDEAAFYGPKIDVQMRNVNGKEDTAFTVQYDFCMPERFEMTFINEKGEDEQPVVIHRSSIGAFERIMAFLIEHYAGAFPLWLSPVQVQFVPVSEKHIEGTKKLAEEFKVQGVRIEVDEADETVGNKVRKAVGQKVPYILVVGDKELSGEDMMVRVRGQEEQEKMNKDKFLERLVDEIKIKK